MSQSYSLIIHGGAGALEDLKYEASESEFRESVIEILEAGRKRLEKGDAALDVVEHCVNLLENNPLYNAGKGSVLNENGQVEMDAALMNGSDLNAGAVTCVKNIKNPISLARKVLEQGDHVMLAADGALEFAKFSKAEICPNDYFITPARIKQLEEAKSVGRMMLDHEKVKPDTAGNKQPSNQQVNPQKLGTVGAVARDIHGNLAAATSTGGLVNKRWGRVGDTPVIGAGVFADNETCGVSATGYGEQFLRTVLAKTVSDFAYFKQMDAAAAAEAGIGYLVEKVNGEGGVIVIDKAGKCAAAQSTSGLIHGWIESGGEAVCKLG
ncbi:MAG: isoaspartyl peptidase/L-asparaginase family protein [Cyanobacteria bacterium P01_A01_bin.116]